MSTTELVVESTAVRWCVDKPTSPIVVIVVTMNRDLELEPNYYNCVYSCWGLCYLQIEDVRKVLKQIRKTLKHGIFFCKETVTG